MRFGWVKDRYKKKDEAYAFKPKLASIETVVDNRQFAPPIGDQGNIGSCTGWAVAGGGTGCLAKRLNGAWVGN